MVHETAAAIEFDCAVPVVHFQVQKLGALLTRNSFRKIEKLGANSLASMGRLDEKFVDPRAFAAIFQAEIEADDQIADRDLLIPGQIDRAIVSVAQKHAEILAQNDFVEDLRPRIILLHLVHQG